MSDSTESKRERISVIPVSIVGRQEAPLEELFDEGPSDEELFDDTSEEEERILCIIRELPATPGEIGLMRWNRAGRHKRK